MVNFTGSSCETRQLNIQIAPEGSFDRETTNFFMHNVTRSSHENWWPVREATSSSPPIEANSSKVNLVAFKSIVGPSPWPGVNGLTDSARTRRFSWITSCQVLLASTTVAIFQESRICRILKLTKLAPRLVYCHHLLQSRSQRDVLRQVLTCLYLPDNQETFRRPGMKSRRAWMAQDGYEGRNRSKRALLYCVWLSLSWKLLILPSWQLPSAVTAAAQSHAEGKERHSTDKDRPRLPVQTALMFLSQSWISCCSCHTQRH